MKVLRGAHESPWEEKKNEFYSELGSGQDRNRRIRWEGEGDMGLTEGTWAETARIEEYLRYGLETQCCGKSPKYMNAFLMISSNSEVLES